MSRTVLGWMTVGLVTLFSGCAMCAHPFDYCGPTVTGRCGDECDHNAPRAGSIMSGSVVPTLAHGEFEIAAPGSTENRLLEELMNATPTESTDTPTAAPSKDGWTARVDAKSAQR